MDNHYLLPVSAMVETMKGSPTVVMLQADLSSVPGVSKDDVLAQVILGQGRIHSCTITTRAGAVLQEQQEAYHTLERCGDLEWSVLPVPSMSALVSPKTTLSYRGTSGQPPSKVPSLRVPVLTPEILSSLSHPYRQVLVLVDGKRSIDDIAKLLSKKPEEVQQTLTALKHFLQF